MILPLQVVPRDPEQAGGGGCVEEGGRGQLPAAHRAGQPLLTRNQVRPGLHPPPGDQRPEGGGRLQAGRGGQDLPEPSGHGQTLLTQQVGGLGQTLLTQQVRGQGQTLLTQ